MALSPPPELVSSLCNKTYHDKSTDNKFNLIVKSIDICKNWLSS